MRAYVAAIASIARPPPGGGARGRPATPSSTSSTTKSSKSSKSEYCYRNGKFLMSLIDEMEREYGVVPNSYVLSGVLLGVDDVDESIAILGEFERRYGRSSEEEEEEEREEEEEEGGGDDGEEDDGEEEEEEGGEDGEDGGDDNGGIVTVQVYNVVIALISRDATVGKNDGWQRALSLLRRMRKEGPEPNEVTYSHVLGACAKGGQIHVAFSLLDEVRRCRIQPVTAAAAAGPSLYLPLLRACADAGDHARTKSIVDMMREDSLEITTEIMNSYLLSLARNGLHDRASSVLGSMMTIDDDDAPSRRRPDVVSCNTVLAAHANAGDYDGARDLFDRMAIGDFGAEVRPDVASYNTVISCADPHDALNLIRDMRLTRRNRDGVVRPNSVTYVNAITRCRRAILDGDDDPDTAFEIASTLLDMAREEDDGGRGACLNVYVYSAAIWMAEAAGDYETAARLLREMGCQPNGVCYDGVISALSKHGLHREALYLYYEMTSKGLKATRKTYQRLVHVIDNSRDPELSRPRRIALLEGESYLILLQGLSDTTNPLYSLLYSNQVSCAGCPSRIEASESAGLCSSL